MVRGAVVSGVVCLIGLIVLTALVVALTAQSALSIPASVRLVLAGQLLVAVVSGAVGAWLATRGGARRTAAVQAGVAGAAIAILLLTLVGVLATGGVLAGVVGALLGALGAWAGARLGTRSAPR